MPLGTYLPNDTATASSSRKRSHAQMTRSESRSASPDVPTKRRRRTRSSSLSSVATPSSTYSHRSLPPHTEGDGFDYRRPIMTSRNHHQHDTIDLTMDDDSPPPATNVTVLAPRRASSTPIRSTSRSAEPQNQPLAPPFVQNRIPGPPTFIDLSDDDEVRQILRSRAPHVHRIPSSSPDLEITGERPAPAPLPARHTSRHLPSPQAAGRRSLTNFLTRGFRMFRGANDGVRTDENVIDDGMLDRIDGVPGRVPLGPPQAGEGLIIDAGDDFEINMDYGRAAFNLAPRTSNTPLMVHLPQYKSPGEAKQGFTRNYKEEDVLVCPMCSEELSTGDDETKQQVWVSKACGHVYCGACATNRVIGKGSNRRDSRKAATRKTVPLRKCQVNGCEKILSTKTAMFPIYL